MCRYCCVHFALLSCSRIIGHSTLSLQVDECWAWLSAWPGRSVVTHCWVLDWGGQWSLTAECLTGSGHSLLSAWLGRSVVTHWLCGAKLMEIDHEIFTSHEWEKSIHGCYRLRDEWHWQVYSLGIWQWSKMVLAHVCCDDSFAGSFTEVSVVYRVQRCDVHNASVVFFIWTDLTRHSCR